MTSLKNLYTRFHHIVKTSLLVVFISNFGNAQDANFSQFYASPTFMNPAFTGTTPHYRLTSIYRNHWLQVPESYETNLVSFEYNLDYYSSGLGILLMNDRAKQLGFMSNTALLSYAYEARISKKQALRFGLQGGYTLRNFDFSQLTFADQINNGGGTTAEDLNGFREGFADFNFGVAYYSQYFWAGLSAHHFHSPRVSNIGNTEDRYPARFSVHFGGKLAYTERRKEIFSLNPAISASLQGESFVADAGLNFVKEPLMLGAWARINNSLESANLLVGFKKRYFRFAYTYDYTLSGLSGESGGSHEISITIEPNKDYRYKGGSKWHKFIECPVNL